MSRIRGVAAGTRAFVRARPKSQKVTAVGAVALLASAPFGGLSKAEAPPLEKVAVGKPFGLGPLKIEVLGARVTTDLSSVIPGAAADPERRLLLLDLEVTNTGSRAEGGTENPLLDAIQVGAGGVVDKRDTMFDNPSPYLRSDSRLATWLNPGLTYPITIVYHQDPDWKGDELTVQFHDLEWVDLDNDFLTTRPFRWRKLELKYDLRVPIEEIPPAPYLPDTSSWDEPDPGYDPIERFP